MTRLRSMRGLLGLTALAGLFGIVAWVEVGQSDMWPALVVAESSFRVSGMEPGRYMWTLEDGRVPQGIGLGVVSQRALVFERNDMVSLELATGLKSGDPIQAGQLVATLRSSLLEETERTLLAERDLVAAQRALLVAGPRPETVEAARKALAVAKASAEGARPEVERAKALVSAGAGSAVDLELAELLARVQALQAELAAAQLKEVSAGARPEELAALDALLASVEARLAQNRALLDQNRLSSPIDGVLVLGQQFEPNGEQTVIRVHDTDPVVLHMPVPQHDRPKLRVGQHLSFHSRALPNEDFPAEIAAISSEASPLNGQQVFWVSATIDNKDGRIQPGISGWVSRVRGDVGP